MSLCVIAPAFALLDRPAPAPTDDPIVATATERAGVPPVRPESLAATISARDLFRLSRTPATMAFAPGMPDQPGVPIAPPPPPRPPLTLGGLLLGEEPAALVDGIPGTEGSRVLHTGDRAGAWTVRGIRDSAVILVNLDSTWTLRLRNPTP